MIARRVLREKAFQTLFAFYSGGKENPGKFEKDLLLSLQRLYEAYLYFLILPEELKRHALRKIEERKNKILPTQDDLNPNLKFVNNLIIQKIENSPAIKEKVKSYNISWAMAEDETRKLFNLIEKSDLYKNYMLTRENDFEEDRQFILNLYDEFVKNYELIYEPFSDHSIFWDQDDIDLAIEYVKKTITLVKDNFPFIKPGEMLKDPEDDMDYLKKLFRLTIQHDEELEQYIDNKVSKWDPDRVALADKVLMKMALCEILYHQSIPVKVSLNEYIDIAKDFSSPESHSFINGILDKIIAELKENNKIVKTGRGLLNN